MHSAQDYSMESSFLCLTAVAQWYANLTAFNMQLSLGEMLGSILTM